MNFIGDKECNNINNRKIQNQIDNLTNVVAEVEDNLAATNATVAMNANTEANHNATLTAGLASLENTVADNKTEAESNLNTLKNNLDNHVGTASLTATSASIKTLEAGKENGETVTTLGKKVIRKYAFPTYIGNFCKYADIPQYFKGDFKLTIGRRISETKVDTYVIENGKYYGGNSSEAVLGFVDNTQSRIPFYEIYANFLPEFVQVESTEQGCFVYDGTSTITEAQLDGKLTFDGKVHILGEVNVEDTNFTLDEVTANKMNVTTASIDTESVTTSEIENADVDVLKTSKITLKDFQYLGTHQTTQTYTITLPEFEGSYFIEMVKENETILSMEVIRHAKYCAVHYGTTNLQYLHEMKLEDDGKFKFTTFGDGYLYFGGITKDPILPPESELTPDGFDGVLNGYVVDNKAGFVVLNGEIEAANSEEKEYGNIPIGFIAAMSEDEAESIGELGGVWEEVQVNYVEGTTLYLNGDYHVE